MLATWSGEAALALGRRAREARGEEETVRGPGLHAPIFLLGCHKSGASLLRALLDGHPQLFAAPLETHFFQATGAWIDYGLRRAWPRDLEPAQKVEALLDSVREYHTRPDRYGDAALSGRFDLAALREDLEAGSFATPREGFETHLRALHRSLTGRELPREARVVEKSVEHAECAPLLRRLFPDARFVHVVRNPYASLVASRRAKSRRGHPYLGRIARSLRSSFYHLSRNLELLDGYRVVRYEDLVAQPRETLEAVAGFLGIAFSETLLQPTLLGESWDGNSSSDRRFRGISSRPLDAWRAHVHPLEILLVNELLGPAPERWGYPPLPARRSDALLPARGESPLAYLRNRALLWTL